LRARELWEQETNVVVVTAGKAEPGVRTVLGSRVVVHRIDPRYFFGFDYVRYHETFYVSVSDKEKTLIDLVSFFESPGREVLPELAGRADSKVPAGYLGHYSKEFASRFRGEALD
jgi:hypothetical protein